ncbi:hypothetical protein [Haloarcula sp. 1CSR25-25]|uniref:hypothetical protein n=1 Tax=Haloarcula sp. 1CSR25-25 TaxID=2862545 RepID=UPI0028945E3E|nr:hypothetical protein [Haloarcula sp. 1CSR25-25]MDT3435561.1 hypothetical protein [Haloarcula sp. 1CSR25-25]
MTKEGDRISDLTKSQVRDQLADETDPRVIKCFTSTREHLEDLSPDAIEAKYGWDCQTVYNWLSRFEERGLEAVLFDGSHPVRLSELTRLIEILEYSRNLIDGGKD